MFTKRSNQKGSALIFALILVLVLSVMGASLAFLSQSETWGGLNYRLMTQSRYGAEAGVNAAANYLMYQYTLPGSAGDPLANYNYQGVSPVTAGGNPVYLSSLYGVASNYPVAAVQTGFNAAANNTLSSGNNNVTYTASAELMSMRTIIHCGNAQTLTAQVWKITSHGDIAGIRNAEAEVTALLETQVVPCYNYAAFATGNGCGSIQFNGGGTIDSYDSSNMVLQGGNPVTQTYNGNLGSNGNVNTANNTVINGTFSSPDTGVGNCAAGGVDALSGNANAITGCATSPMNCNAGAAGIVKLPQVVNMPAPVTDYPGCTGAGAAACDAATAAASPTNVGAPLSPGNYGDIGGAGKTAVVLNPGTDAKGNCVPGVFYINSLSLAGKASLSINPCPGTGGNGGNAPAVYEPIIVNIVGSNQGTPLDIGGNGIANPSWNSSLLQIQYAGSGGINLHGNGTSTAVIYAPNAQVTLSGNGTLYGSVIGAQITSNGNPVQIHYDRALAKDLLTVSNWTLDSFTWSKF